MLLRSGFASLIEREVFATHRRALVIMGDNHLARGGDRWGNADVTDMLESEHHPIYVLMLTGASADTDPALRGSEPSLYVLRGTALGKQRYLNRRFEDAADAFLYLGPKLEVSDPNWKAIEADQAYFREVQRRHLIEFGCVLNLEAVKTRSKPCQ